MVSIFELSRPRSGYAVLSIGRPFVRRFLPLVCVFLAIQTFAADIIRFQGQKISDPKGEYQVTPMGNTEAVVYADRKRHFSLVLPYSESWEFSSSDPEHFTGRAGLLVVTLEMFPDQHKTDRDYLEALRTALLDHRAENGTVSADLRDAADRPVVAVVADPEVVLKDGRFKGIKHYSLFTSRVRKGVRYRYHLSVTDAEDKGRSAANAYLKYVVRGFLTVD
jgi:hypothetical protein